MSVFHELRDQIAGRVSQDEADLLAVSRDESGAEPVLASLVVLASSLQDVQTTLAVARSHRTPVATRGGGSGKSGGCIPKAGGIVLRMDQLKGPPVVDPQSDLLTAKAGVTTAIVTAAANEVGRYFAPDPGAMDWCTIGGNVATNAAGPRAFKYGAMRHWVMGLQVVTGAGEVLQLGAQTLKRSTGFDLTGLCVGSEGTLGVITEVTLRMVAPVESRCTVLITLASVDDAVPLIHRILSAKLAPSAIELLDATALTALRARDATWFSTGGAALLLELESDGPLDSALARLDAVCDSAVAVRVGRSQADASRLWQLRAFASDDIRKLAKHKLSEDVCVPRARLAELVRGVGEIADRHQLLHAAYGHAGDGNLHVNFLWNDDVQRSVVDSALWETFQLATQLGGTISGEHGIGQLKRQAQTLVHSAEEQRLRAAIKRQFDPLNILNP